MKNPFLIIESEATKLKENHTYFYQIQMQLALTKMDFCYFYIWGPKESKMLKVYKNETFWNTHKEEAKQFAKMVLVPELMANFYRKFK